MNWRERLDELGGKFNSLRLADSKQSLDVLADTIVGLSDLAHELGEELDVLNGISIEEMGKLNVELARLREYHDVVERWTNENDVGGNNPFADAAEDLDNKLAALDKQEDTDERKD